MNALSSGDEFEFELVLTVLLGFREMIERNSAQPKGSPEIS